MMHYTYLITDTLNQMYYIGVRSCEKSTKISELKRIRDLVNRKICGRCEKDVDLAVYGRWHSDKCKSIKEGV